MILIPVPGALPSSASARRVRSGARLPAMTVKAADDDRIRTFAKFGAVDARYSRVSTASRTRIGLKNDLGSLRAVGALPAVGVASDR